MKALFSIPAITFLAMILAQTGYAGDPTKAARVSGSPEIGERQTPTVSLSIIAQTLPSLDVLSEEKLQIIFSDLNNTGTPEGVRLFLFDQEGYRPIAIMPVSLNTQKTYTLNIPPATVLVAVNVSQSGSEKRVEFHTIPNVSDAWTSTNVQYKNGVIHTGSKWLQHTTSQFALHN